MRALAEEGDCLRPRQRGDRVVELARYAKELSARNQDPQVRARRKQLRELGCGLSDLFEVVEQQLELAELDQLPVDERPRRCRHDHLTAVARSSDPGGSVKLAPGIALTGQLQLARVHSHPHQYGARRESLLTICCGRERLDRIDECEQKGVPLRVDLDPAVLGKSATQEPTMLG